MMMLLGRDRASIFHMLSIYLACFATGAMALFFMGWLQNLHQREMLDMVARKNLLIMETRGCCSADEINEMSEELYAAGFENLDFAGTTMEETGYGQEIRLNISGTVSYEVLRGSGGVLRRFVLQTPFSVHLTSTAKH